MVGNVIEPVVQLRVEVSYNIFALLPKSGTMESLRLIDGVLREEGIRCSAIVSLGAPPIY